MTTDTVHKIAEATIEGTNARIVGVAKGVGMIEPNMATLITMMFTDANIAPERLDAIFRRVIDRTFNCVSVDTDTSTSDTAVILASGAAGKADEIAFESALHEVALSLTKQVARDGEGAETLIEVTVDRARDTEQAKRVAKSIVNSPLVKTAVHGADPNWGRVAMAVGKCNDIDIDQEKVVIRFGEQEVFPRQVDASGLERLSNYMKSDDVLIHVSLNNGNASATVWGCDLTDGYVRINADYTT
jgi:glutamate N-acetyltransferase/amino-acid N-acetyltransferase